ncbi:hypothetical protein Nepgr_008893 [Nepenthes gracilis]|uniref:Uncharacterized protein n=1 Tax=Nepenthes gracilis TaxID=150966 RepID=A0AAD3S9H3_NEPGR|nr:hypothetical protein Nepgr_008893 [Nepenthes gracilis]
MQTPKNIQEMVREDYVEKEAAEEKSKFEIRDVWAHNLKDVFTIITEIVDVYPYVAVHSVSPGVGTCPVAIFKNSADYNYEAFKGNVNNSKLIQLGLSFFNEEGTLPTDENGKFLIWQFNFRGFDVAKDVYTIGRIELPKQSGIDYKNNDKMGIDLSRFGELLMPSGIVLNDEVRWVAFHSAYDFGYLLKVLTGKSLPDSQEKFLELANVFFPVVYDIRHLMKFCDGAHDGLNKLAEPLGMEMIDTCHQAGKRSLLACRAFMKLKDKFFNGSPEQYAGALYGLGEEED